MDNYAALFGKSLGAGSGGSGTDNYNELTNKPSINGVVLSGNKTPANLGLQPEIKESSKLSSDLVDDSSSSQKFVSSSDIENWNGKQNAIPDLSVIRSGAEAGATAVQPEDMNAALAGKQDALTFDNTPKQSSTNPVTSGGVYTDQQRQETEIGVVANAGAKNLLPMTHTSEAITRYGVTCTWDLKAGTMTLNGTHSSGDSAAIFELYDGTSGNTKILPAGSYVLTGCPAGGSTSTYRAALSQITGAVDVGNGANFELSEPHYAAYRIIISGNITFNNMVFKPMLRPASITDSTFVPYAPTNRELYEMILALQSGASTQSVQPTLMSVANTDDLQKDEIQIETEAKE